MPDRTDLHSAAVRELLQTGAAFGAALLLIVGCGSERTFTASEFVNEVRANGVELTLGEELLSEEEDKELYAVELEPLPGAKAGASNGEHAGTSGSISVYEDIEGADDELATCRASADLLCYQAANIVVVLEGGGIEAQRLAVAMEKLAE